MRRSLFQVGRFTIGLTPLLCLLAVSTLVSGRAASVTLDTFILKTVPGTDAEYDEDTGEEIFPAQPPAHTWARGEFGNKGSLNTGGTAFAGQSGTLFDEYYRSYFGFDLRGQAGQQVKSAVLRLYLFNFFPLTGSASDAEPFSIHETSIHPMDLLKTVDQIDVLAAYQDLGHTPGGGNLGSGSFSRSDKGSVVDIVLSAQAVALINSAILNPLIDARFFGVGVTLDDISQSTLPFHEEGLQFALGNSSFPHQLILTYVPDGGTTLAFLTLGGAVLVIARRRRKD